MPKELNVFHQREIERMDEQLTKTTRPAAPRFKALFNVLLIAMALLLIAIVAIKAYASPEDHVLCRVMVLSQVSRAGRLALWDDSIEAWQDMPADLGAIPIDLLYLDETMDAAYYLMFSASKMELWIFPYWSLQPDDTGTHNFCPVVIYDLNPETR